MILPCMKPCAYEQRKDKPLWGARNLAAQGLIHCSPPEYFWRVAPIFAAK